MSTNTKHSYNYKLSVKRATRRTRRRQQFQQQQQRRRRIEGSFSCRGGGSFKTVVQIEGKCKSKLTEKLEALKNLIPANNGDIVKPDQLFKETADYIVMLRTRVLILQKLIAYYGNNPENENAVLL